MLSRALTEATGVYTDDVMMHSAPQLMTGELLYHPVMAFLLNRFALRWL